MTRGLILYFLLSLILPKSGMMAQGASRNIVIFFGANETRPAYSRIVEGIKSAFPLDSSTRINLISEYLDLERFSDSFALQQIVELYNERVKENSIDLVITVAPSAYDVLNKFGLKLLKEVPVINLELNPKDPQDYIPGTRIVEVLVSWSPAISMAHAFDLFPKCKHAYVLGGCAKGDLDLTERFAADTITFKDTHRFTFLSCTTMEAILDTIAQLPDSCLVFLASYSNDANNTPFSTSMALPLITAHSSVPVFTMSDNFIEYGGVGGKVISFNALGAEVGLVAKGLFTADTTRGLTKVNKSYYRHQYNWKELKKWGIANSKVIPAGSTYFFKDVDFLTKYRWQIFGVSVFILLQTLLISYLIRVLREQRKVARQKVLNEQLYRQLLREERVTTMALLTASLAHELNQPLTAILFNTQAGLRFLQSGRLDDPQAKSILEDIEEDVKRASGIISSVRSMMQLEARQREPIELNKLTNDVLHILHTELKQNLVQVIFEYPENDVLVSGNRIELQQVIINLLLNAVTAMKHNSPEQKLLLIKLTDFNGLVSMVIADNGPGIPEDLKEKLFDPFTTSRPEGIGIGLALCKSIITLHGGEIQAQNRPEGGAEFSITLPVFNMKS